LGFGFLSLFVVPLYRLVVVDEAATGLPRGWVALALLVAAYPLLSFLALRVTWPRVGEEVSRALVYMDLLVLTTVVYLTGGPSSWLFFIGLIVVADQAYSSSRRALLFAHLAPALYLSMVLLVSTLEGAVIDWRLQLWKLAVLYLAGLYFSMSSVAASVRKSSMETTIRAAHETIASLELESRKLVRAREQWRDQAHRDPLTGLLNRKGILEVVGRGLMRSRSGEEGPFSIVAADLDEFKSVNDTRGHAMGDEVLRRVANTMLASGRAFDAVGRIGGDEFLIALPNCDQTGAERLADRIRQAVADHCRVEPDAQGHRGIPVEVSIGVATADGSVGNVSVDDLLVAADKALYAAKGAGGDCVFVGQLQQPS
jgi:diguanylate cyclase (GGDEF)-like protein